MASLITLLEAGTTPWRREWDAAAGGHHVNLLSGRRYRGANPVLLSPGPCTYGASALPYWCGFCRGQGAGDLSPQGQQGRACAAAPGASAGGRPSWPNWLRPMGGARAEWGCWPGSRWAGGQRWVSYRPVAVFNAADLEGEALAAADPAAPPGRGGAPAARARAAGGGRGRPQRLAGAGAPSAAIGPAICRRRDRIQLPDRSAFHSAAALYATWAHEAIHSTGHGSRLARDLSGGMGAEGDGGRAYAREELVAELGAVLLGRSPRDRQCHGATTPPIWATGWRCCANHPGCCCRCSAMHAGPPI